MSPDNRTLNEDQQLVQLTDELIERMRTGEQIDEVALVEEYPLFHPFSIAGSEDELQFFDVFFQDLDQRGAGIGGTVSFQFMVGSIY